MAYILENGAWVEVDTDAALTRIETLSRQYNDSRQQGGFVNPLTAEGWPEGAPKPILTQDGRVVVFEITDGDTVTSALAVQGQDGRISAMSMDDLNDYLGGVQLSLAKGNNPFTGMSEKSAGYYTGWLNMRTDEFSDTPEGKTLVQVEYDIKTGEALGVMNAQSGQMEYFDRDRFAQYSIENLKTDWVDTKGVEVNAEFKVTQENIFRNLYNEAAPDRGGLWLYGDFNVPGPGLDADGVAGGLSRKNVTDVIVAARNNADAGEVEIIRLDVGEINNSPRFEPFNPDKVTPVELNTRPAPVQAPVVAEEMPDLIPHPVPQVVAPEVAQAPAQPVAIENQVSSLDMLVNDRALNEQWINSFGQGDLDGNYIQGALRSTWQELDMYFDAVRDNDQAAMAEAEKSIIEIFSNTPEEWKAALAHYVRENLQNKDPDTGAPRVLVNEANFSHRNDVMALVGASEEERLQILSGMKEKFVKGITDDTEVPRIQNNAPGGQAFNHAPAVAAGDDVVAEGNIACAYSPLNERFCAVADPAMAQSLLALGKALDDAQKPNTCASDLKVDTGMKLA